MQNTVDPKSYRFWSATWLCVGLAGCAASPNQLSSESGVLGSDAGSTAAAGSGTGAASSTATHAEGAGSLGQAGTSDALQGHAGTDGHASGGAGGSAGAAGEPIPNAACTITSTSVLCHSETVEMITTGGDTRRIYWNTPAGTAPGAGWPAVVLFQGSLYGPSTSWDTELARDTTPFGGDVQVLLISTLLDHGFVVVQPEAQGGLAWNTNNGSVYDTTTDAVFIPKLLDGMQHGTFGTIDMKRLYATGISSGGYMTSRMAVSFPGKFRALAIESGAYATCLGPICTTPATLPSDHPPTLFLHGTQDTTVPIGTAREYFTKLQADGIETQFIEDTSATHQWIDAAPEAVLAWFSSH